MSSVPDLRSMVEDWGLRVQDLGLRGESKECRIEG